MGWPDEVPFDAILVSAGGPQAPEALKHQLKIGGRLILPVGDAAKQRLLRIRRLDEAEFHEDDLGGVCFVPLIGAEGWHTRPA
jgi:protein-L-isoaspartate O-methyltransferase